MPETPSAGAPVRDLYDSATHSPWDPYLSDDRLARTLMLPDPTRSRPSPRRCSRLRHAARVVRCRTRTSTGSPTASRWRSRGAGSGAGDVVALVLPPGAEYLLAYLAVAKLGAITAGVNDRLSTARERDGVLGARRAAARARRTRVRARAASTSRRSQPPTRRRRAGRAARRRRGPPLLPTIPTAPVAIIFTSGTTGLPKGALYRNRQLSFITHNDVGDTWGGGGRSFSGTSFAHLGFMTKLPGQPPAGRHEASS